MKDFVDLGGMPAEEQCAQTGSKKYDAASLNQLECRAYIHALERIYGKSPDGGRLHVKSNSHDFGTYYNVRYTFDANDAACIEYMNKVEKELARWSDAKMWPPVTYDDKGGAVLIIRSHLLWDMEKNPKLCTTIDALDEEMRASQQGTKPAEPG